MAVTQKIRCRVERIDDHGGHVYSLSLRPASRLPRFRPGQFLHLALDPYDPSGFWPESRVFSIASAPEQRDALRLTYSVQGQFTARMERELAEGQEVWVKLPYGEFVIDGRRDAALLAGGTGITAFTAFLASLGPGFPHRVMLAYGARTRDLLIYRGLAAAAAERSPALRALYFVEQGPCGPGETLGRLSAGAIWPHLADPAATDFYLSGPPPMLSALAADLRARGVAEPAIRIDAWE